MNQMYQCTAFQENTAVVTTNDEVEYNRLVENGAKVLCHPNLFSQQGLIPFVVYIPLDKLASLRQIPIDSNGNYETQLY